VLGELNQSIPKVFSGSRISLKPLVKTKLTFLPQPLLSQVILAKHTRLSLSRILPLDPLVIRQVKCPFGSKRVGKRVLL